MHFMIIFIFHKNKFNKFPMSHYPIRCMEHFQRAASWIDKICTTGIKSYCAIVNSATVECTWKNLYLSR